jgi:hypothetical protein
MLFCPLQYFCLIHILGTDSILLPWKQTLMGTFSKAAITDYHLSFADQGKQTSDFRSKQTEVGIFL